MYFYDYVNLNTQHIKIISQNDKEDTMKYTDKMKKMYTCMIKQYNMFKSLKKQKQSLNNTFLDYTWPWMTQTLSNLNIFAWSLRLNKVWL